MLDLFIWVFLLKLPLVGTLLCECAFRIEMLLMKNTPWSFWSTPFGVWFVWCFGLSHEKDNACVRPMSFIENSQRIVFKNRSWCSDWPGGILTQYKRPKPSFKSISSGGKLLLSDIITVTFQTVCFRDYYHFLGILKYFPGKTIDFFTHVNTFLLY